MDRQRWSRIKELFEQAAGLPSEERSAYLDRVCEGDAELRSEVESLLRHDTGTAIDDEASPLGAVQRASQAALGREGDQPGPIDRFRLIERLGQGGMGEVWRAEQLQPVRRLVAVKIVQRGLDTAGVIARFAGERQALARMDHPNVARIYDAGETAGGRPYFAMELVEGEPIVSYCASRGLSLRQRVELFAEVCAGVQHAHHKALIHRDLKPSNILVTEVDGRAVPKIIDFGIAKATEQRLTERTLQTELGMLIGTPEYMSPEQASGEGDVDARTDVYSLGVVLYQLLTGELPIEGESLRQGAPHLLLERLLTTEPARPSQRASEPQSRRLLRGELDWITMRALEKDRERRYQSPGELREDLQRYLAGEAVQASPPSTWYRLRKTVQRHRALVLAASAVTLALLIGTVVATRFALGEAAQRRQAESARADLEKVVAFQADMIGRLDVAAFGDAIVGQLQEEARDLDDATPRIAALQRGTAGLNSSNVALQLIDEHILANAGRALEEEFADQPLIQARLERTIGQTYDRLGLHERADPHLRRAHELQVELLGPEHLETLETDNALADNLILRGRMEEAAAMLQQVYATLDRVADPLSEIRIETANLLALALIKSEKIEESEPFHLEYVEATRSLYGEEHPETLTALGNLAVLRRHQGRVEEAESLYLQVYQARRRTLGEDHDDTLSSANNLGVFYDIYDQPEKAEEYLRDCVERRRRVLGDEHQHTLLTIGNLANALVGKGEFEEAIELLEEVLTIQTRTLGEDHFTRLHTVHRLGYTLELMGRFDDAEPYFREATERRERIFGPDNRVTIYSKRYLGWVRAQQGRLPEGEAILRDVLQRARRVVTNSDYLATIHCNLGDVLARQQRWSEAAPLLEQALALQREAGTEQSARAGRCRELLTKVREGLSDA